MEEMSPGIPSHSLSHSYPLDCNCSHREMWMKQESRRMWILCPEIRGKKRGFGRAQASKGAQSGREGRKRRKKGRFWSPLPNAHHLVASGPPSWVSDTRERLCDTPGAVESPSKKDSLKTRAVRGTGGWGWYRNRRNQEISQAEEVAAPSLSALRLMGACSPTPVANSSLEE